MRKKSRSPQDSGPPSRQPPPKDVQSASDSAATLPSRQLRWILSGLIVLQLLAVVAEPFRFFTRSPRGTSPISDPPRRILAPWIEFAYLNHGYFFFAPEPGPSHLIECGLTLENGDRATLRFPDRQAQWPRLLYHRHFMMAENLHQLWAPPLDPQIAGDIDPGLLSDWRADRQRFEMVRDSMIDHVAHRYGATDVTVDRLEHRLPSDDEVLRQRMRLNDRRLYIRLPDAAVPEGDNSAASALPSELQPESAVNPLPLPPPREELP